MTGRARRTATADPSGHGDGGVPVTAHGSVPASPDATLRSVTIVGTGLIGASIGLALRGRGVEVMLADGDDRNLRTAVEVGAGRRWDGTSGVDLAVVAVPPAATAGVLADLQRRGAARYYTDAASVKAAPLARARDLGVDLTRYVPGHPLAGREVSGPGAARGDLFLGRPWALCPAPDTAPGALAAVRALIAACGATPVTTDVTEHDHAVALVSHAPHVAAAVVAAALTDATGTALDLAGQGVRDVTRIAAGDPALWREILTGNAAPVAEVLDRLAADLGTAARALRSWPAGQASLVDLLRRGNAGRSRIPGKHGGPAADFATVPVVVGDRPGQLALAMSAADDAGVNIEDIHLDHAPRRPVAVAEISVRPDAAPALTTALRAAGLTVLT